MRHNYWRAATGTTNSSVQAHDNATHSVCCRSPQSTVPKHTKMTTDCTADSVAWHSVTQAHVLHMLKLLLFSLFMLLTV